MISNTSLESYDLFSWDDDGLLRNAFNSPLAFIIYKWSAIIVFLFYTDLIYLSGLFVIAIFGLSAPFFLLIHEIRRIFSSNYAKCGDEPLKNSFLQSSKLVRWLWHGYEAVGWKNIPKDKPVIFYAYHGPFAIDAVNFCFLLMERNMKKLIIVAHKNSANFLGFKRIHRMFNYLAYTREEVIEHLNDGGHFFTVYGGTEESRLSDNNYRVHFGRKQGLAHVIKSVNRPVAVLPIFSRNIQEAFWIPWFGKSLVKYLPKWLQPIFPPVGGLPVKLTTFIGKEVEYDLSSTPTEIMEKLWHALQQHIDLHQIVPGNKWRALKERFCPHKYSNTIEV